MSAEQDYTAPHELLRMDDDATIETVRGFYAAATGLLSTVAEKQEEQLQTYIRDVEYPAEDLIFYVSPQDALVAGLDQGKPAAVRIIHQYNLGGYDGLVNIIISSEDARTQIIIMDHTDPHNQQDASYEGFMIRELADKPPFVTVPTELEVSSFMHVVEAAGRVALPLE